MRHVSVKLELSNNFFYFWLSQDLGPRLRFFAEIILSIRPGPQCCLVENGVIDSIGRPIMTSRHTTASCGMCHGLPCERQPNELDPIFCSGYGGQIPQILVSCGSRLGVVGCYVLDFNRL